MNTNSFPKTKPFVESFPTVVLRDRRDIERMLNISKDGWLLLVCPRRMNFMMMDIISGLGESGPVRVVDGGNCFDAHGLARKARGRSDVLDRITVSRAFTCYQVLSLLESTPADEVPFVVLDMLRTFYDEAVPIGERRQLLRECIAHLDRLYQASGGVVSIYPPSVPSPDFVGMSSMLQASAAEFLIFEPVPEAPEQTRLF